MAKVVARNAYVRVIDGSNASTLLSNSLNTAVLTQEQDAPEVNVFGQQNKNRMFDGIKDWSLKLDGYYEGNTGLIDEVLFGLVAGSCIVDFGPTGSTSGSVKYSGCAILQSYEMNFQLEDAATISATFQARTGSMTRTTW